MQQQRFVLPCGVLFQHRLLTTVTLKEFSAVEEALLGSKDPDLIKVITNCVVAFGVEEHDVATSRQEVSALVKELLAGDSDFILLKLRIMSLGAKWTFDLICPACRRQGTHSVDLNDVDVIQMPKPEERTIVVDGEGGRSLVFRLLTIRDRPIVEEIRRRHEDVLGKLLSLSLVSIDGEDVASMPSAGKTEMSKVSLGVRLLASALPTLRAREQVRRTLKEARGYPDFTVESECPSCSASFAHEIPVTAGFLLPSAE